MEKERPARRELNLAETRVGDLDVGGARPGPAAVVHGCLPGGETSFSSAVFAKEAVVQIRARCSVEQSDIISSNVCISKRQLSSP